MAKRKNGTGYNGGHIRPTKYGTFRAEICLDGKQTRQTFKSIEEARGWIDAAQIEHANKNMPLVASELREAREAISMLPEGVGLAEVARYWMRHHGDAVTPQKASVALEEMIDEKLRLDRRDRSIDQLRFRNRRLIQDRGDLLVNDYTTDLIRRWMEGLGVTGRTWNNYRADLHNFFGWCRDRGYCAQNPITKIPTARRRASTPVCFEVETVREILYRAAKDWPVLVPWLATGFFAGVRTAELGRIDEWCFVDGHVRIGPEQAKTSQQRYIEILPNFAAWLEAFPPNGALETRGTRYKRHSLQAIEPKIVWVHNGMRHSFASYHLARFKDAAKTAHELGHPNARLLYNTYRTLATHAAGVEYFDIYPP